MPEKPTGRIQITGLTPDEIDLIKDAARIDRRAIRDWALYHARNDIAEARWARPSTREISRNGSTD